MTDDPTWRRFTARDAGFSIELPSTWEALTGVLGSELAALEPEPDEPGVFRCNVNVVLGPADDRGTLADQALRNVAGLGDVLTDPELLDAGPVTVGDRTGQHLLISHRDGRDALTLEQWYWPMPGDRVAVVSGTVANDRYAEAAPGFAHIAESLEAA